MDGDIVHPFWKLKDKCKEMVPGSIPGAGAMEKIWISLTVACAFSVGFFTIFPEIRNYSVGQIYSTVGLDKPVIEIISHSFSEDQLPPQCRGGPYLSTSDEHLHQFANISNQTFINLNPDHDLKFTIRSSSEYIDSPITITKVIFQYVGFKKVPYTTRYSAIMECGGGPDTEKIYSLDPGKLIKAINRKVSPDLELEVSNENAEKFDYLVLDNSVPEERLKVFVPLRLQDQFIDGLIKFRLKIVSMYKGAENTFVTSEYVIGTDEWARAVRH